MILHKDLCAGAPPTQGTEPGAGGWGYSLWNGDSQWGQCMPGSVQELRAAGEPHWLLYKNWGLSLSGGMGLSCQLSPSSVPWKVTLGPHITATRRDSGSLQHTCSHIANGTGIIAALWEGKIYNARLDKTFRRCQLDVGRTPARWSICTWKSMWQKTGLEHLCCPQQGSSLLTRTPTPRRLRAPQGGQFFIY